MSLVKKIKDFSKVLMLSAGIGLATTSCATGNWEYVKSYPQYIRTNSTTQIESNNTIQEKEFDIKARYSGENKIEVEVIESLNKKDIITKRELEEKVFQEIRVEERKRTGYTYHILFPLAGLIGGSLIDNRYSDGYISEDFTWTLVGGGIGFLLSFLFPPGVISKETRETSGRVSIEGPINKSIYEEVASTINVYKDRPAKNISVQINESEKIFKTNNEGLFYLKDDTDLGLCFTTRGLENKLYEYPLIQNINPQFRGEVIKKVSDKSTKKNFPLTIETKESTNQPNIEKIINDSKIFNVPSFYIDENYIFEEVNSIIQNKINSQIKTLELLVKDDVTRMPILGYSLELKTNAPSKKQLAEVYFNGKLVDYSINKIRNYLTTNQLFTNLDFKNTFRVYSPCELTLELTHPNYNFLKGNIKIEEDGSKTAYMIEKGTKVIIGKDNSGVGRIEDNK